LCAGLWEKLIEKNILIYGVIISTGYGVVRLQGFLIAFIGEVFRICCVKITNNSFGLVVNLSQNDTMHLLVGALLLHRRNRLDQGSSVQCLSGCLAIMLGDFAIGSILDPVGNLIFNSGRIDVQYPWVVEAPGAGIIDRQSVTEGLATGVISIDSMIPIGRGQRELIIGDRQTGKTSIVIDAVLNQKYAVLFCVYVSNGQSASSILSVFLALIQKDAIFYLSVVGGAASSSAVHQFLSAYTGSALAEFFVQTGELPSLLCIDDLSRHGMAYREIYLLLRRPPGREGYPGEIFFVHSRLLERSAKLACNLGGGSLSCFPVIETLAGDVSAYISTNVISITDGQIALSSELAVSGIKPAIDVGLSVTRVGSIAQWYGMKLVAGFLKLELAQFIELQSFSQFVADLGKETKNRLTRGRSLMEIFKQFSGSPINLTTQVGILSLANQNLIDSVSIKDVQLFLNLYLHLPVWAFLFVAPTLVGKSLVCQLYCHW
jgi:F-type H+-transporting ATPase subunit alpha